MQAQYAVSWSKDRNALPSSALVRDGRVYIQRSTISDAGIYTCTGGDSQVGVRTADIRVEVRRVPGKSNAPFRYPGTLASWTVYP